MSWFSRLYDPLLAPAERLVFAVRRRELLAATSGRVLELGAGTGANLPHYPADVDLVLTEPDDGMRSLLVPRAERRPMTEVHDARGESLPFPDASFDVVVATLVLCSVRDPARVVSEVRRVLRDDGRFLFLEHVASEGWRGSLQRGLDPAWQAIAGHCHLHRDPLPVLAEGGFEVHDARVERPWVVPPFLQPILSGVARPGLRGGR
ncbi:MAG: class I SAM-dependent methyltransferase [Alphaproteobacteria bacterium]|nr:class I SAM-dependent methyltransferase [Alphaproteobacteria bacterium]MCB9696515.1 class I SAM-dependent methyltransferase [Alphaproteobacteria bacterium]